MCSSRFSIVSGTPLNEANWLNDPIGPPKGDPPLSPAIQTTRVLSSSPRSSIAWIKRPIS